jgi:GntR family transcriptional regulator
MMLRVAPQSPVPIYEQIVSQLIFSIAAGGLEAGTLIPSVRELAQRLLVHPNTVARAFQELERRGVVTAKRGVGMEITPEARKLCREERQEIVRSQIRDALRAAVASALPADAIRKLVDDELNHVNGSRPREKRS